MISISKAKNFNKKKSSKKFKILNLQERFGPYYLRFTTEDKPGVISGIANEFKKNHISMKSMLQKDIKNKKFKNATIVITTHDCNEKEMFSALSKINKLKFIKKNNLFSY